MDAVKPEFSGGAAVVVPTIGFRERLAYLRWLRNNERRVPESDAMFARATGLGYSWLKKWMKRHEAPTVRKEVQALMRGLELAGIEVTEAWLVDNVGKPPHPEQWRKFLSLPDEDALYYGERMKVPESRKVRHLK